MSRLLVTAAFGVVAFAVAVSSVNAVDVALARGTSAAWATAAFELLRFAVVQAFTVFVATRGPSVRPSRRPLAFATCAVALASFASLHRPSASATAGHVIAGDVVAAAFEAWLLLSVLALGRCFGILPEARGLVTRGPYRLVRHPLYLGEFGAIAGFVIAATSWWNFGVAAVAVASQLVRIQLEEAELTANFPEYRDYAARTPMLLPVPWRRTARGALVSGEPATASAISGSNTRRGASS